MLYVVATPIGNLEDITLRALRILKEAHTIICEDTRHTGILLQKYEIKKPLLSFHAHSPESRIFEIIDKLKNGEDLALVSDAGTPGISDPGYRIITAAIKADIQVIPIPGAAAFLTALCAAGVFTDKFIYYGFLPQKKGRQTLFLKMKEDDRTIVFYESPHRLIFTLQDLLKNLGDRPIVIARELTKIHEEFWRGTVSAAIQRFQAGVKGEIVVMIPPEDRNKLRE